MTIHLKYDVNFEENIKTILIKLLVRTCSEEYVLNK